MGKKNFQPDKPAKITGGPASTFNSAVSEIMSKGTIYKNATVDPWAKHVNQIDWEVPYDPGTPGTPHD